ncbi:MAG: FtsX-like permease family protein [Planctomycetes bacterium]|nr:FtsX-like permease family protein [Planctomycetota bacterium]
MRLTSFLVCKSWASDRLRTLLSVAGVALGVAVVTAIHVVDHNTIQSRLLERGQEFGRVDLELQPRDPGWQDAQVEAVLAAHADVAAHGRIRETPVALARGAAALGTPQLFGIAPLPSPFRHYAVAEGRDLHEADGTGAVLVAAELARLHGLRVGDRVALARVPERVLPRCRDGVLVAGPAPAFAPLALEVEVAGILAHERLARRNLGQVVVGTDALARRLGPDVPALHQVARLPGRGTETLARALSAEFEVLDARAATLGEAADERAFRNGVKVLGCLALVLGMFVVFQTLSHSLVERLRQIGLLRCLGAGRGTVASVFLLDATLLAVAGAALGVGGGIGLARILQELRIGTLGFGRAIPVFEVPFWPCAGTALLGVLFTLAGASFPLWKARNLPALAVLHGHGLGPGGAQDLLRGVNLFLFVLLVLVLPGAYLAMTPLLAEDGREILIVLLQLGATILLFGGVLLLVPRLVLGLGRLVLVPLRLFTPLGSFLLDKAMARNPGRFAASVCGLAVVLLALLALKHVTYALRGETWEFGARTMLGRLFLEGAGIGAAEAATLGQVPGVRAVEPHLGRVAAPIPLSGLAPELLAGPGGPFAERPELARRYAETRSVVVSRRLARLRGLAPGGILAVTTSLGVSGYTVLAVSDASGFFPDERAFALAHPRWLQNDFCVGSSCVTHLTLHLHDGANAWDVLREVRRRFPGFTWAKRGAEIVEYLSFDVTRDFRVFDVLLALILGLSGVGLVNAMTIAALARHREIGVLRALGMDRAQLRTAFVCEGLVVAVLGAGLAVLLGLLLGRVVVAGLNEVSGLEAPVVVPWPWVVVVPALALGLGVLAAVLPALRAARENPADAVRYE